MNEVKIYLPDLNEYINLRENFPIEINYNIADIREIQSRKKTFSKTINIPGNQNNNNLFKNIFDISNDITFNINKKQRCIIYQNDILILNGFFQLKEIVTRNIFSHDIVSYNIIVQGTNANFFDALTFIDENNENRNKELTDLNLSGLTHTYSSSAVTDSWTHTDVDGYTYPMIDYGINNDFGNWNNQRPNIPTIFSLDTFRPAIFVKYVWDKIFDEAGYTYNSDFLNSNTFKKLILPHYKKDFTTNDYDDINSSFRAGLSGQTITGTTGFFATLFQFNQILPFNNVTTNNNFDNGGIYDETTFTYTSLSRSFQEIQIDLSINFELDDTTTNNFDYEFVLGYEINGIFTELERENGTTPSVISVQKSYPLFLDAGDEVRIRIRIESIYPSPAPAQVTSTIIYNSNSFWGYRNTNIGSFTLVELDTVDFNTINLLEDFTQLEFIKYISTLYNLYFEPDPNNDKLINIEPRDKFYQKDNIIDWTDKLETNTVSQILLPDLQNKRFIFKNAEDNNDVLLKKYIELNNAEYGERKINVDNDFLSGDKIITTPFASTAFIPHRLSSSIFYSSMKNEENRTYDRKPRLLYFDGLIGLTTKTRYNFDGSVKTSYPRALHLSNPLSIATSDDLNWDVIKPYSYQSSTGTTLNLNISNANLYNMYWDNTIFEITSINSRLIKANVELDENDINSFSFRKLVEIRGNLFRVNKIVYSTLSTTAKVELIKVLRNSDIFIKQIVNKEPTSVIEANINNGNFKTIQGIIAGNGNVVDNGNATLVVGDNNTVNQQLTGNTVILGLDDLSVNQSGVYLPNDFNIIDISGNTIQPNNNIEITESNLIDLISNNGLVQTQKYFISDLNIIIEAINENTYNRNAIYVTRHPKTFYYVISAPNIFGVYTPISLFNAGYTTTLGDTFVWGYKVWEATAVGTPAAPANNFTLDPLLFTQLPLTNNTFYEDVYINVYLNDAENAINTGLEIQSYLWNGNLTKLESDFNQPNVYGNRANIILNNNCIEISNNLLTDNLSNNESGIIKNNIVTNTVAGQGTITENIINLISNNLVNGSINNNIGGSMINNQINGDIENNLFGEIFSNKTNGRLSSNQSNLVSNNNCGQIFNNTVILLNNNVCNNLTLNNVFSIVENAVQGDINLNLSVSGIVQSNILIGNISSNQDFTFIQNNINKGSISNNTVVENIIGNANDGNIQFNSNNGNIQFNSNNGIIANNTSTGATTFSINNNQNNGQISFNNATADIVIANNINNGNIGLIAGPATNRAVDITDAIVNK